MQSYKIKNVLLMLFIIFSSNMAGQFKKGLYEVSVSGINHQYGMPFIRFAPFHPGIEIGLTLLKKEGTHFKKSVSANFGYLHHKLLIRAPYLRLDYLIQYQFKNSFGLGASGGLGYLHGFYPGDAYKFNESKGVYEQTVTHQAFLQKNIALHLFYLNANKIKPFIKYDFSMLNFQALSILTNFHIGTTISLDQKSK